jgi:tetratricopeptide (TPR) repeat protein
VTERATQEEVKAAFRKIVLQHHPDRSSTAESRRMFDAARDAVEVLGDPRRRRDYDSARALATEQENRRKEAEVLRERTARQATQRARQPAPERPPRAIAVEVNRMSVLFSQGRHGPAEDLARDILRRDPRQPLPYAVLGDILRARGRTDEAAHMYAYAVQFDGSNTVYQRRYEELLAGGKLSEQGRLRIESPSASVNALAAGGVAVLLIAIVVAAAGFRVTAPWPWMLAFVAGLAAGLALSVGQWLDRFGAMAINSVGRPGPVLAFGAIALVNFWASVVAYMVLGAWQRAFNRTVSLFMAAVAGVTLLLAAGAALSPSMNAGLFLLLAGNLVYVGAACGWLAADSLR